jgi:hypothetical protein
MMVKAMTSMSAIEDRVRRKLKQKGQSLRKPLSATSIRECGNYYILDDRNYIAAKHINLIDLAKELGVLKPGEKVE